ncbi:MAG: helix-turn-helix transcriptional regulator [Chitinophagaceae bacterium]
MFTGEKIRLLRITRHVKQSEMARRLGISQQRYSALENSGFISEEKQVLIMNVLKYSMQDAQRILSVLPAMQESGRSSPHV